MAKKLDHWCDINWLIFICVTGAVTAICAAFFWNDLPLGAKGAAFAAVIMPLHVLEEWKFPGGLHYFYNIFFVHRDPVHPDQKDLMRYPMSRLTDMITNICLQWIPLIYLVLTLIFPSLSNGVTIAMILFCYGEVAAHVAVGILTRHWYKDLGKTSIYDPGLCTAGILFLPAGTYLLAHLHGVTGQDWLNCLILFLILILISVPLTETPIKKWVIKQEEGMFAFANPKYFTKYAPDAQEEKKS